MADNSELANIVKTNGISVSLFNNQILPRMLREGIICKPTGYKHYKMKEEEFLFSESPARYLVEINSSEFEKNNTIQSNFDPFVLVGETTSEQTIVINDNISFKIDELREEWKKAIPKHMED